MSREARPHLPRITAAMRESEQVTPLELFFDLVFVLALTQCTALMADDPTWAGLGAGAPRPRRALVVVGRLRLADQRGRPRGGRGPARRSSSRWRRCSSCALCVPEAFGDLGLIVRGRLRGRPRRPASAFLDRAAATTPNLRHSVDRARDQHRDRRRPARRRRSQLDGVAQGALWALALAARHGRPVPLRRPRAGSSCPATSPSATA